MTADQTIVGLALLCAGLLVLWLRAELLRGELRALADELMADCLHANDHAQRARADAEDARLGPTLCPQTGCPLRARLLERRAAGLEALACERKP